MRRQRAPTEGSPVASATGFRGLGPAPRRAVTPLVVAGFLSATPSSPSPTGHDVKTEARALRGRGNAGGERMMLRKTWGGIVREREGKERDRDRDRDRDRNRDSERAPTATREMQHRLTPLGLDSLDIRPPYRPSVNPCFSLGISLPPALVFSTQSAQSPGKLCGANAFCTNLLLRTAGECGVHYGQTV